MSENARQESNCGKEKLERIVKTLVLNVSILAVVSTSDMVSVIYHVHVDDMCF